MADGMRRVLKNFEPRTSRGDSTSSPSPVRHRTSAQSSYSRSSVASLNGREAVNASTSFLSTLDASPIHNSRPGTPNYGLRERSTSASRLDSVRLEQGVEVLGDSNSLRTGLEDLRSSVRELQKHQRQASRSWRSELEAAVDAVQAKLTEFQREALDQLGQELRSEMERKVTEAHRSTIRRIASLEDSVEVSRAAATAETTALRTELAGAISAVSKLGPDSALVISKAHANAQLEVLPWSCLGQSASDYCLH